ncbi:MAG: alpha/beta hydrolase family protein [Minisyncoccota bacterium]
MKKTEYPLRVRFAKDIVAEVILPDKQTGKVAIFASGFPSSPNKKSLLQFLARQGYVAIFPRYRGTWESDGFFLERSPAQDIRDVIDDLTKNKGFINIATGEFQKIKVSAIHLFGASFGGSAVILNSHLPIVKKVIALAPVLDWSIEGESEPFVPHIRFVKEGFGGAYRVRHPQDWHKLIQRDFYNPIANTHTIVGKKIFLLHCLDDTIVPYEPIISFAQKTRATYFLKPKGGHSINITHLFFWKKISVFLGT